MHYSAEFFRAVKDAGVFSYSEVGDDGLSGEVDLCALRDYCECDAFGAGVGGACDLEFSNTTPLPAKIYAGEGVAQFLFFEADETCAVSYKDRQGKYQNQRGITVPKA